MGVVTFRSVFVERLVSHIKENEASFVERLFYYGLFFIDQCSLYGAQSANFCLPHPLWSNHRPPHQEGRPLNLKKGHGVRFVVLVDCMQGLI